METKVLYITEMTIAEFTNIIKDCVNECLDSHKLQQVENNDLQLMSIQELSKFLNLSVPTLYSKVSRKQIPFLKNGKRLYFRKKDIINHLEK